MILVIAAVECMGLTGSCYVGNAGAVLTETPNPPHGSRNLNPIHAHCYMRSFKILTIQEDPILGKVYAARLSLSGYAIEAENTIADGLKQVYVASYDLIYLDICATPGQIFNAIAAIRALPNVRRCAEASADD